MPWPLVAFGIVVSLRRATRSSVVEVGGRGLGNQRVDRRGPLLVDQRLRHRLDALGLLEVRSQGLEARVGRRLLGLLLLVGELVGLALRLLLRLVLRLLLGRALQERLLLDLLLLLLQLLLVLTDRVEVLLVRLRGLAQRGWRSGTARSCPPRSPS